jgi:restriction system protein
MSVPTYDAFIEPVLRYLAAHTAGAPAREVYDAAAKRLGLTEPDLAEILPSGRQPVYKNRAGWAHDRLKRVGYSASPRRGFWCLTEKGKAFAAAHLDPLSSDIVASIAAANDVRPNLRDAASQAGAGEVDHVEAVAKSPDDRLLEALDEIRRSVAADLLDLLHQVSPAFFEGLVLDVLHRMGYGASRGDLQRVGGTADSGIDGIISLDKLGLEKVYVQAKRWQQAVGRPEVQAFYGALAGQRARKGVLIATSAFTPHAREFARSVEGIVLVDGVRLAQLMIDHEVGVTLRPIQIPKIDSDYFDENSV